MHRHLVIGPLLLFLAVAQASLPGATDARLWIGGYDHRSAEPALLPLLQAQFEQMRAYRELLAHPRRRWSLDHRASLIVVMRRMAAKARALAADRPAGEAIAAYAAMVDAMAAEGDHLATAIAALRRQLDQAVEADLIARLRLALALALLRQGDHDSAEGVLLIATVSPGHPASRRQAALRLASLLHRQSETEPDPTRATMLLRRAAGLARLAADVDHDSGRSRFTAGQYWLLAGDHARAVQAFLTAYEQAGNDRTLASDALYQAVTALTKLADQAAVQAGDDSDRPILTDEFFDTGDYNVVAYRVARWLSWHYPDSPWSRRLTYRPALEALLRDPD